MSFAWAALGVAVLHTFKPGHWLPYVAAARAQEWSAQRLVRVALAGTLVHLLTTLVLAGLMWLLSQGLAHLTGDSLTGLGGVLLLALGAISLLQPQWLMRGSQQAQWLIAVGVGIQPCVEILPVLLVAAVAGPAATLVTALVWAVITLVLTPALVLVAARGLGEVWRSSTTQWLQRAAGVLLMVSGLLSLWHGH